MDKYINYELLSSALEVSGYALICGLAGATVAIFLTYGIFKAFRLLDMKY